MNKGAIGDDFFDRQGVSFASPMERERRMLGRNNAVGVNSIIKGERCPLLHLHLISSQDLAAIKQLDHASVKIEHSKETEKGRISPLVGVQPCNLKGSEAMTVSEEIATAVRIHVEKDTRKRKQFSFNLFIVQQRGLDSTAVSNSDRMRIVAVQQQMRLSILFAPMADDGVALSSLERKERLSSEDGIVHSK